MRRQPLAASLGVSLFAAAVLTAAALPGSAATPSDGAGSAAPKSTAHQLFTFKDPEIKESSGIETSVYHRSIVFTHNDSGDDARFFAVGPHGKTRAIYTLDGAGSWDWEDMSAGPHNTLWFGDIGANQLGRDSIAVYRVREPKKLHSRTIAWTRYNFVYDDGQSHNAEALLVNPVDGTLLIVTKSESGGAVYKATRPLSTTQDNTLHRMASAPVKVTGGDFAPNGKRFVLRTYGDAYFYKKIGGHATKMDLPSGGESIAFARYRPGVIVGKEGVHSPVWWVTRT